MTMSCEGVSGKGWLTGRWASAVPVAVGFADTGVDDLHRHDEMFEIYLVVSGTRIALVDGREVELSARQVLIVEPGENHTLLSSSQDYFHYVVQAPFVAGDKNTG